MDHSPVAAATLYAIYFKGRGPHAAGYARLARVFEHSARVHCPGWEIRVEAFPPLSTDPTNMLSHWCAANTIKLEAWQRLVATSPNGHLLLLTDADMAVLRPLDPLLAMDFDLAYTVRPGRLPFNGGVLAVRVSDRTRRFMEAYVERNRKMLHDSKYHQPFRRQFGGINQAAFGSLLDGLESVYGLDVRKLPGSEWNCEQSAGWHTADPTKVRLLHVKSSLRRSILYGTAHAARPRPRARVGRTRRVHGRATAPRYATPPARMNMAAAIVYWTRVWYDLERAAMQDACQPSIDTDTSSVDRFTGEPSHGEA